MNSSPNSPKYNLNSTQIQQDLLSQMTQTMREHDMQHKKIMNERRLARNYPPNKEFYGGNHLEEHQHEWKRGFIDFSQSHKGSSNKSLLPNSPITDDNLKSEDEFDQVMHKFESSLASQRLPASFINKDWCDFNPAGAKKSKQRNSKKKISSKNVQLPNGKLPKIRTIKSGGVCAIETAESSHSTKATRRNSSHKNLYDPASAHHSTTVYTKHHLLPPVAQNPPPVTNKKLELPKPTPIESDNNSQDDSSLNLESAREKTPNNKKGKKGLDDNTKKLLKRAKRLSHEFKEREAKNMARIYGNATDSNTSDFNCDSIAENLPVQTSAEALCTTPPRTNGVHRSMKTPPSSGASFSSPSVVKKSKFHRQMSGHLSRQMSKEVSAKPISNLRFDASPEKPQRLKSLDRQLSKKLTPYGTSGKQKQLKTGISFGMDVDDTAIACGSEAKHSHMRIAVKEPKNHFTLLSLPEFW